MEYSGFFGRIYASGTVTIYLIEGAAGSSGAELAFLSSPFFVRIWTINGTSVKISTES
jgi:hypothetical protein